jgi:hypothetical protein
LEKEIDIFLIGFAAVRGEEQRVEKDVSRAPIGFQ